MPGSSSQIFNQRASERLRNPDDLDKYLRMTNPSVWAVLAGCAALLIGMLVWGVFGTITPNVSVYGVCQMQNAFCLVTPDEAQKIHEGDDVLIAGVPMTVKYVSGEPISRDEAKTLMGGDYLVSTLMEDEDWAYIVDLEGDVTQLSEGVPLAATITVEHIAPITLVLGGGR